ncbi:MAG: molybdate ABC transporter permease subunit [Nitriliruptoraceae bacterium]|nr:molybdate ABC transporter permease subunit [Nitriliruptoraceae bacterium]
MTDLAPPRATSTSSGVAPPRTAIVLGVVGFALLVLPLVSLTLRTPWTRVGELITDPVVLQALRLSLVSSLAALVVSVVLGVPLALVFARYDFPGKPFVRALAVLPMVLPPVVGGVGLLAAFGRRGLVGQPLAEATGITLPFTSAAVVIAATFVAMPFLIVTVEAGLRMVDPRLEDAAATLGADRWTILRRVVLPALWPSLAAGMALCWARALGEFGATITFAGNLPGRTQTMPLAVYLELERNPEAAYLISFLLLAVSVAVLVALRDRFLRTT